MSKIIVFGAGHMGIPIAYALRKLGHAVTVFDKYAVNITQSKVVLGVSGTLPNGYVSEDGVRVIEADVNNIAEHVKIKPDVVVSALPFWCNKNLASYCIHEGIRYVDLGGDVETTEEIVRIARIHATLPVATDQGLAPGLVNIVAEAGCTLLPAMPDDVLMAVGGLPAARGLNPLEYLATWSIEGLVNEYQGEGWAILNGKKTKVDALSGVENIAFRGKNLEAFYTSGGSAHSIDSMLKRGVRYCAYKTMRYPGHRDMVRFLMNKCGLSNDLMGGIFKIGCSTEDEEFSDDAVKIHVELRSDNGLRWVKQHNFTTGFKFSAMQRTTGYSVASVAHLLSQGFYDNSEDKVIDYEALNIPAFHDTFKKMLKTDEVLEEPWIL